MRLAPLTMMFLPPDRYCPAAAILSIDSTICSAFARKQGWNPVCNRLIPRALLTLLSGRSGKPAAAESVRGFARAAGSELPEAQFGEDLQRST
jgi:hypothetical protein